MINQTDRDHLRSKRKISKYKRQLNNLKREVRDKEALIKFYKDNESAIYKCSLPLHDLSYRKYLNQKSKL